MLRSVAVVFGGYSMVMLEIDRRLQRTGGPGIIGFELAGDDAPTVLAQWGEDGRRLARLSLRLDFGYMASYGALTALLLGRARRRLGHGTSVQALVAAAVACDAVEGVALLSTLDGHRSCAPLARRAALTKFALIAACLGYAGSSAIVHRISPACLR
ncbi:hypothetical protein P0W64_05800 [Tsukamurella sp. 8F]|uniref:hypothetical protein n=1 Tax=unclassified Tsukamurella TaxID=2633480 RepID=UPI0023B9A03B|nr:MULTISPECIES: hypothetical protein [unclassified Tsukamurella]MDF0528458.1 hypothetical protein [Tsukamurella sp. 8J]MDF0586284.1 hypothetical protein [Tsukamurella sp. 8F]